ncbi:MAG TPA: DUF1080 domain-containing protein [Isosphaeraceae bacterium]|jgi:hypothetical protein|nr:DUF1080 domain-containing protein [Isosphaeraceae bacterium]
MSTTRIGSTGIGMTILLTVVSSVVAEDDPFTNHKEPPVVGRWDITVHGPDGDYPSWLEVTLSGYRTLVGSYVGRTGSARPIAHVIADGNAIKFTIPPQWERRTDDLHFTATLDHGILRGETTDETGRRLTWEGNRAPSLARTHVSSWGEPVDLFNGHDLTGWRPRNGTSKNGWVVRDGILTNATPGNDLVTERKFDDFKLHAEFRYPKGSNSGIYLRGRYEMQVEDNYGDEPESHKIGGIYGFLTPSLNASKPAGEWQTVEATLVGRTLTVVLNGERIIDRQAIPGPTGGALDSHEAEPGSLMLQGDHGSVEFRKLTLIPAATVEGPRGPESAGTNRRE